MDMTKEQIHEAFLKMYTVSKIANIEFLPNVGFDGVYRSTGDDHFEKRYAHEVNATWQGFCLALRYFNTEDGQMEIRDDGERVRRDRWETGIRQICYILNKNHSFEIDDLVEEIRKLKMKAQPHWTDDHIRAQLVGTLIDHEVVYVAYDEAGLVHGEYDTHNEARDALVVYAATQLKDEPKQDATPAGHVKIPQSEEEAQAMSIIVSSWLSNFKQKHQEQQSTPRG